MSFNFSRRSLLQGALAAAGAAAASKAGIANAQVAEESAVVMIFLRGGYNALFSSADSFSSGGTFGCAPGNVTSLGNGLVIDSATYGTLPQIARNNMAAIGVNHGISSHDPARLADWTNGSRSYALMLANAMGGNAAIRCPVLGGTFPDGPRPQEGNVSMQAITDLSATINALGGGTADPTIPSRAPGAAALISAKAQSSAPLAAHPNSLKSVREAYDASIAALQGAAGTFDFPSVASAYGFTATQTTVNSFRAKMMAAEVMISAGAKVAIAVENSTGWDTHGDTNGSIVRTRMNATVLPGLRTFLSRMMAAPGRNVTVCIFGDFARSLPGSDHARCVSATVIGKKVRVGTTGRVSSSVGLPQGSASVPQLWSYLAAVSKAPTNPFGANPHSALVLP